MKISTNYYQYNPNFGAINLSAAEIDTSAKIIKKLKNKKLPAQEYQNLQRNLFNILSPKILNEAKAKANFFYIADDVYSEMSLMFSEFIHNLSKRDSLELLINKINKFRPSKNSIKSKYMHKTLDVSVSRFDRKTKRVDIITEKDLPAPKSAIDIEKDVNKLDNIIDKEELSDITKSRMKDRVRGAIYKDIADKDNVHKTSARRSIKKGILKLQQNSGSIPPKIAEKVKMLSIIMECSEAEILKAFLKDVDLPTMDLEILTQNIENAVNLLKCTKKEFIKAGLRFPQLFHIKTETIMTNIQESAKAFQCSEEEFIVLGLKEARLFYSKPETLHKRVKELAAKLDCTEQDIAKLFFRAPSLFFQTTKTLITKMKESRKAFQCTQKEFIKTVFKQPQLLYLNTETMLQNMTETARLIGIDREKFIKTALKQPQLLEQKPQTIFNNVTESAKLIGCTEQEFIKQALGQPCLFCQKPETNARKTKISNYYRRLKNIPPQNNVLQVSDKKLYNHVIGLLIKREELKSSNCSKINVLKFNLEAYLKTNPGTCFNITIPNDEIVPEFIKYVQNTSLEILGKNIFEFNILE